MDEILRSLPNMDRKQLLIAGKILLVLSIVLVVGYVVAYFTLFRSPNYESELALSPAESPNITTQYFAENESVKITVGEGGFSSKSERVALKMTKPETSSRLPEYHNNFTIRGYGKTKDTHIWAIRSILGHIPVWTAENTLGIGYPGMTQFPIEENESITIVSDDTDTDNDGTNGIENNETITLYTKDDGVDASITHIKVRNNKSIARRFWMKGETEQLFKDHNQSETG